MAGEDDLYGYCFDDPVNGVDPLGLWTIGGDLSCSGSIPFIKRVDVGGGYHVDDEGTFAKVPHIDNGVGTNLDLSCTGTLVFTTADKVDGLGADSNAIGGSVRRGENSIGAEFYHSDDWWGGGITFGRGTSEAPAEGHFLKQTSKVIKEKQEE